MNLAEQKRAAKAFCERWRGRGDEKQDCQSFWTDFLEASWRPVGRSDVIRANERGYSTRRNGFRSEEAGLTGRAL